MSADPQRSGFTLVEILVVTALLAAVSGIGVVSILGVLERTREARLQNDVAVVNNGIDAYLAAGGVIPPGATAPQVLAKLKTIASPDSTVMGFPGPFVDQRLQLVMQSADEGAGDEARADYPNEAGYFFVRKGGAPGIKDFVTGEASPVVSELRQGAMPYTPEGEYLTAYTDRLASTPANSATPQAAAGTDAAARAGKDLVKLPRPSLEVKYAYAENYVPYRGELLPLKVVITNGSSEASMDVFPITLRVTSPLDSPRSQLRVEFDGMVVLTNPWSSLFNTIDAANPNGRTNFPSLLAQVVSMDTNNYTNSDQIQTTVSWDRPEVTPVFPVASNIPAQLTYFEAGGPMLINGVVTTTNRPDVTISLSNIDKVPSSYLALLSGGLVVSYTDRYSGALLNVTNTAFSRAVGFQQTSVPINVAGFGTSKQIAIVASIESANPFLLPTGANLNETVDIVPTVLSVDILPLKPIGLPPAVTITHSGAEPVGMRKLYTLTTGSAGSNPLSPVTGGIAIPAAANYGGPITNFPIATYTVVAQATGPTNTEHWFTCEPVSRTYIAITRVPLKYIGLNMFRANINGYVKGSIYMQAGDFAVLNAGATVEGNVYLPGTPAVFLPASGALVVRKGQAYDQSKDALISTNRITGREYTTEGTLADPQSDLRKIVDLYGSTEPSNYEFRGTETSRIDGKLYRRADPPPVTSVKPGLPTEIALSNAPVTVAGTTVLASGSYALTLNNTNSVLQLGSPGNLTKYVFGAGSTWTAGRVEILGPVQIFFNSAFNISGVTFGSSNSIYQTGFVVMSNYSVSIGSGAAVYGQFEARDSVLSVENDGAFYGSAFAQEVAVSGRGYIDVSGGSDTNSL